MKVLALSGLFISIPISAGVIHPVPANFVLDGQIGEWAGIPPNKHVSYSGDTAGSDLYWFGTSRSGLVVAGQIGNHHERFASNASEFGHEGHLNVWISVMDSFELPEITYSEDTCALAATLDAKKACLEWRAAQIEFREGLRRQFWRMWRIAPNASDEAYALPAFDSFSEAQRRAIGFPRPSGVPIRSFQTQSDGSRTFEILIPWDLFPPADRLNIERVRFAADFRSSFEPSLTPENTSRQFPPTFSVYPPITTRITTCGQPLLGKDLRGEDRPAFHYLKQSSLIDEAFIFQNLEKPSDGFSPNLEDVSPGASRIKFFTQELGNGEFICGPFMSYRSGQIVKNFPIRLGPRGDHVSIDGRNSLTVKRLPDGTRLIQSGPDISWGSLWTKAFLVYSMRIYVLTKSLLAYEALNLETWSDSVAGYEIELSDDWRTVTEFREDNLGKWTSERFCLGGNSYASCGKNLNSSPPKKRVLTSDR